MNIWDRYKTEPTIEIRNEILLKYNPLVKQVARRMASSLPAFVSEEDLASYGLFGLLDAIEKFDPERGYKFETYAVTRIQGSILDELRYLDWVPRSVRAKTNAIERVMTNSEHGMPLTEREAAEFLGMTNDQFNKFKTDESVAFVASLDMDLTDLNEDGTNVSFADLVVDPRSDFAAMMEYDHIKNKVALCINKLPERERMLVYLYYFEQMTLANIGKLMKVTESRVCQIHTSVCLSLKEALAF